MWVKDSLEADHRQQEYDDHDAGMEELQFPFPFVPEHPVHKNAWKKNRETVEFKRHEKSKIVTANDKIRFLGIIRPLQ